MANSESSEDLLKQFSPVMRAKLRGTEIASDADRLRYLLTLARDEQEGTVCRLNLGLTWDAALPKAPYTGVAGVQGGAVGNGTALVAVDGDTESAGSGACGGCDASEAWNATSTHEAPRGSEPPPLVVRVALSELRPNPVNATIFSDSLADDQLRDLADHLLRYGQQEPIRVDPTYTILDGERRWGALKLIGAKYANVVVDRLPRSPDELEDLVIDAFSLKRKPSLKEQLRVYDVAVRSYTRRYGRKTGRPRKLDNNLSGFWSSKQIRTAAAKAAGFGSREPARQALRVMAQGDEETKKAMLTGRLNISAAYATLRASDDGEDDDDDSTEVPEPRHERPCDSIAPKEAAVMQADPGGHQGQMPPLPGGGVVHPETDLLPDHDSHLVNCEEPEPLRIAGGTGRGEDNAELPSNQMLGPDSSRPSRKQERKLRTPALEEIATAAGRPERTSARTESSERQAYLRARATVVRFLASLREHDEVCARRERDAAVLLIDAAAYGTSTADSLATPDANGRGGSSGEGAVDADAREGVESDILLQEVEHAPHLVDGEDSEEADLNVAEEEDPEEPEGHEGVDEAEDDEYLGEWEDDDDLDGEDEEEEDLEESLADQNGDPEQDATDEDGLNVVAEEATDDEGGARNTREAVIGDAFDYSDYFEDGDDSEPQDLEEHQAEDEAHGEEKEDWSGDDEQEEEEDRELDELIGFKRARRR